MESTVFQLFAYLCIPFQKNGNITEEVQKGWRPGVNTSKVSQENKGTMPKVKTNSSAKKRFKVTATGKITHQKSFKRHILTKKSTKRKRGMRIDGVVAKSNMNFVQRLLRLK
ncbi:50S ribosomal protein L35 [Niabella hirudinis]|uniref:50S ribosomal protein L35 n=1 Tax=Niabella hirudinis TaxID=1285929 RepID=UPI003EBCFC11